MASLLDLEFGGTGLPTRDLDSHGSETRATVYSVIN